MMSVTSWQSFSLLLPLNWCSEIIHLIPSGPPVFRDFSCKTLTYLSIALHHSISTPFHQQTRAETKS